MLSKHFEMETWTCFNVLNCSSAKILKNNIFLVRNWHFESHRSHLEEGGLWGRERVEGKCGMSLERRTNTSKNSQGTKAWLTLAKFMREKIDRLKMECYATQGAVIFIYLQHFFAPALDLMPCLTSRQRREAMKALNSGREHYKILWYWSISDAFQW